ncbi:MAG: sugar phosphate isomerase/epimerase [Acidobacteria bacterium]|nr:sugar phosphate isomerase/epimerase [Acidobacteriota bacterium]
MNHAVSTHFFINHRLTTAAFDKLCDTGISAVEIFCARQHLDYRNRAQIDELAHWFRDSELKLHSLHSPMYNDEANGRSGPQAVVNIADPGKVKRIAACDEIKRALEIAEQVPFRYLVQHLGAPQDEYDDAKFDAAFSSLDELRLFARHRGVEILLENIPNGLSSAEKLLLFLRQTHLDLGFCFDTGHANIMGGVEREFELMQTRIRSLHVHDNDGTKDAHLFPSLAKGGTIKWATVMPMLRAREHQYPLLLELKESPDFPQPLEAIPQIFKNLESF